MQRVKFPLFVNRVDSANKKLLLRSCFPMGCVLMKRNETFCKAGSVTKPCLKIVAKFCMAEKHAADKVEQIPLSNNEHSMYSIVILLSYRPYIHNA